MIGCFAVGERLGSVPDITKESQNFIVRNMPGSQWWKITKR